MKESSRLKNCEPLFQSNNMGAMATSILDECLFFGGLLGKWILVTVRFGAC